MAAKRKRNRAGKSRVSLRVSKLKARGRARSAATAAKRFEHALGDAAFRRELIAGTEAMFGIEITPSDPEE